MNYSMTEVSLHEAQQRLFNILTDKKNNVVLKSILDALNSVASEDIYCIRDLPSYNNSALDGYAIKYEDRGKKLKIKDTVIFAGVVTSESLKSNECFKIMTGAKIPDGADTIIRFEDTVEKDGYIVVFSDDIKQGNAFRVKGEECKVGSLLIPKGTKLTPSHIATLASQGISFVKVYKKLKILVFSTGNELKEPFDIASSDEFYNINAYTILSLLSSFNIEADYGGILKDSLNEVNAVLNSIQTYDVVLTSGGASAGEADFIKQALNSSKFKTCFTSIRIKPGRPTISGILDNKILFISLPGNPLAAFFNTYLLAIPAIKKLSGDKDFLHVEIRAKNKVDFKVKNQRTNIVLGHYLNGEFRVTDGGKISSGMIEPLLRSNCLLVLNEDISEVKKDDIVSVLLFK